MVVERVTHRPLAALVHERMLDPLEMSDSGVLLEKGAPYLMAASWASAFGAAGDMYASAHDLLRWGDALYGGSVLRPAWQRRMLDIGRHEYGLGVERLKVGGLTGYGHSGLLRGFTSLVIHLPDQDMTLVVMGTLNLFDPAVVLSYRPPGEPSILDLAVRAARAQQAAPDEAA
jgi:CubicO group peptidase (beta-lactamase class C family)